MKYVWVHGLGQTPDAWNKTILLLGPQDAICPNLAELIRGKEATYRNLYEAFSAVCNAVDESLCLCGLSLGGVLALNYAIDRPEKVESLVLIGAQYKMPRHLLRFQNALFRFMPRSMFQQMGFGKAEFLKLCRTMMELDFSDSLKKVTCPSLVICGGKDNANKAASIELADRLVYGKLQVLDGVGHEVNIEAPEKLAEVIEEFFRLFNAC